MANTTNKSAPKNATNTAPAAKAGSGSAAFQMPDFESWEKEQIGFAPYWNPEEGKAFYGAVIARDERDPEFTRYLCKALMPMTVHRGPKDEAEEVAIQPGDLFSISVYFSLAEPFDFMLENFVAKGDEVPVYLKALKEVKTKKVGQTCWTWEMRIHPDYRTKVRAMREHVRKVNALDADAGEREAIAELS